MNITPEERARLEQVITAMQAHMDGKPVEARFRPDGQWEIAKTPVWTPDYYDYRPAPVPQTRPWSKPEDVPGPVCWLRHGEASYNAWLVLGVTPEGVHLCAYTGSGLVPWSALEEMKAHYSTDRITWKPCVVQE